MYAANFARLSSMVCAAALLFPAAAEPTDFEYDLMLSSAYVWRGLTVTDGAVLQPTLTVNHDGGLSVSVWGNLDLDDVNDLSGQFRELDLTISYGLPVGEALDLEIGFIEYLFPNVDAAATRELYATFALDLAFEPYLSVFYDFGEVDDLYLQLGLSRGGELSATTSWEAAVWAGWSGDGFAEAAGGSGSGFSDGNVSLTVTRALADGVELAAFVQYVGSLDDDALPAAAVTGFGHDVEWLGGIVLTISR